MAAIPRNLGRGGAYLTEGHGDPSLLDILDGIADDLASIVANVAGLNITAADPTAISGADPTAISGADPTAIAAADPGAALATVIGGAVSAVSDPPTKAEVDAIVALVNQLRTSALATETRANELRDLALDFKPRFAEYRTLVLDEKARFAEYRTLILDVKARLAEYRTLILELKTDVTAGGGVTLVTTKAAS